MADYSFDHNLSGTLSSDVTLGGLEDMSLTLDGGTTTTLAGATTSTVSSDSRLAVEPLTTSSTIRLEPVESSASVDLDIEPVSVDSCLRIELGPPPPTEVRTPYQQRWALSVLGQELFALSVCGESTTEIRPAARRPLVVEL